MMLASSPALLAAIDEFETKARLYETFAGECRDVAALLRRTCSVSTIVPSPVPASAPAAPSVSSAAAQVLVVPARPVESDPVAPLARGDQRESVRAFIARAGGPIRIGAIREFMGGAISPDGLRAVLRELCASGAVLKAGERAACRYSAPTGTTSTPASPASRPAHAVDDTEAEDGHDSDDEPDDELADVGPPEQFRSKVAFFLLKALLVPGSPMHIGDLVAKVHERFGSAPLEHVNAVLRDLVSQGELERFTKGGEAHYQRAVASGAATFALRAEVKKTLMTTVFHVSEEVPFERVIAAVKPLASVSYDVIKQALNELVVGKSVSVRTVGLVRRFRRVASC